LFVDLLDATHIWLSDRENAEAAFGAAVELPLPVEANLEAGLAVSPDGLDVVFIEGEFARLGMLRRESRAAEFVVLPAASAENPAGNPLTALNSQLGTIGARGTSPVYHPLGAALYFNQYRLLGIGETALIGTGTISRSSLNGTAFAAPAEVDAVQFRTSGVLRRPTAVASDELSVFYWDDETESARVVDRESPLVAFGEPAELGAFRGATPNPACTRLYYATLGAIWVAPRL
jgi:hypothetical protein